MITENKNFVLAPPTPWYDWLGPPIPWSVVVMVVLQEWGLSDVGEEFCLGFSFCMVAFTCLHLSLTLCLPLPLLFSYGVSAVPTA